MENQKLERLIAKSRISKGIGLTSILAGIIYMNLIQGTVGFNSWTMAILVLTGVIAIVISNVISIQIIKLKSKSLSGVNSS